MGYTNESAIRIWASGIASDDPHSVGFFERNSIHVEGPWIYSFGHHYPMGYVDRRADGTVRRVVVTSSYYPNRGFASTPKDQGNVVHWAEHYAREAGVPVEYLPLSSHGFDHGIRIRPRADDPEPMRASYEVQQFARPRLPHPGPEPVKSDDGCIAGTVERYSYQTITHEWDWQEPKNPQLYRRPAPSGGTVAVGAANGAIVWGEHRHEYADTWARALKGRGRYHAPGCGASIPEVTYKQCPHCEAFDRVHDAWSQAWHGDGWRGLSRGGWGYYLTNVELYGSEDAWRLARKLDVSATRRWNKRVSEWSERNHIPWSALSHERTRGGYRNGGVPKMRDGYPLQRDVAAYWKGIRDRERRERRYRRETEARRRYERQVERFARGIRRRQRPSFEQKAAMVAAELIEIRERIDLSLQPNDRPCESEV